MYTQKQAMENYNYYNDSRVRAAMRSSCWKLVSQGSDRATILLDDEWALETFYHPFIEQKLQALVDAKDSSTDRYRMLSMLRTWGFEWERREKYFTHPDDSMYRDKARRKSSEIQKRFEPIRHLFREEADRLYAVLEAEYPPEGFFKTLGIVDFCIEVATKFEVCDMCRGHGTVVNPNIDAGGLCYDDFREDPEFADDYFNGRFDVTCPQCNGLRVEAVPQFPEWLNEAIDQFNRDDAASVAEQCAELRMGA